jgi:biotin carboxylase
MSLRGGSGLSARPVPVDVVEEEVIGVRSTRGRNSEDLPLLAVVYGTPSFGLFDLAEAARGTCRLAFVVDGDPSLGRLLRRLGPVIDITGLDDGDAARTTFQLAPDGITTFMDRHLLRTAFLAAELGLPFHSPATAQNLFHKHEQRGALRRAGLPGPNWVLVPPDPDVQPDLSGLQFPVVVKPDTGAGSRETTLAGNEQEVMAVVTRARSVGIASVVVEEFLPGVPDVMAPNFASFVSVESVIGAGQLRHLAVTGKFPLAYPFRETGHFIPSHLPPPVISKVLEVVTAAIIGVGITIGAVHSEVKLTPRGPRIIEVNGRVAGAIPEVLSGASGFSLLQSTMSAALGGAPASADLVPCERIGYRINVQPPTWARRVRSIDGIDALHALPGVASVGVLRNDDDPVDWRLGTDELVLAIIGSVESLDALEDVRCEIDKAVTVHYE